jgi:hypothetical protein
LAAVGALQIKRTNQRLEAVHWLEALGKKAALRWPIRVAIFTDNLKPLGKKAIVRRRDVRFVEFQSFFSVPPSSLLVFKAFPYALTLLLNFCRTFGFSSNLLLPLPLHLSLFIFVFILARRHARAVVQNGKARGETLA